MFGLLRFFSIASAVALAAVAVTLVFLYRQTALEELLHSTEHQNVILTRSLANALWPRYGEYVKQASAIGGENLGTRPETWELHETLRPLVSNLSVLKLKIYNIQGLTVYSTDVDEIGADVADNTAFLAMAAASGPASQMSHEHKFKGLWGMATHKEVIESYLPVLGADGAVEGVIELYSDVTHRINEIDQTTNLLLFGLTIVFSLLYAGLILIVRHADLILNRQYGELETQIARRIQTERDLRAAKEAAEAGSQAKSQFLANMSHELRTPLNAVIGFSEVIADEVLGAVTPSRYRGYASNIRDSGRHLLDLVNDVLELARIETGDMEVEIASFDVGEAVDSVARSLEPDILARENTLEVRCPEDLGAMDSDAAKVRGILTRVLDNAAKFTREGRIEIAARRETGAGSAWIVFTVTDTGIGMDSGEVDGIFKDFTQSENPMTRTHGGAGLGLSISRRFCELLGGVIDIESEPGKGSTVTIRLPDQAPRANEAATGTGADTGAPVS